MLDEELKNIKNNCNLKKIKKQSNNLKIMTIIQFICLIIISISIVYIVGNYRPSSMYTLNITLSASGFLAILIFFIISKLISKSKIKFKSNYYDIVMFPIIKKVNSNWTYLDENNMSEIIREFILADFYESNIDRFFNEKSIKGEINVGINVLIHQISTLDIIGYGQYRKLKTIFNGIFAVVETNIDQNFNLSIKGNNGFVKTYSTLNNIKIKNLAETFGKETLFDFDLVIKNGKIYFRIFSGNIFKEHIFKKLIDKSMLENYYLTLKFIQEISNEIIVFSKTLSQ